MKTASHFRILIALMAMTAIACSEPDVTLTGGSSSSEYRTGVTTWVHGDNGNMKGLITQTPDTDLSTVNVFVVRNGQRIEVQNQFDTFTMIASKNTHGEYFWASYQNKVLFLNYIGMTVFSPPPFPLEVIIVY